MATLSVLRVMLISAVALYALSCHGRCATTDNTTLRVDLLHRDSPLSPLLNGLNLSYAERMRRALERSHNRQRRLQRSTSENAKVFNSPLTAADGAFLMRMSIGSPVQLNLHFIMDTGSDLMWTQCQPCDNCLAQNDPIYDSSRSHSYTRVPCSSPLCSAFKLSNECDYGVNCEVGVCDKQHDCFYRYPYRDSSYTMGILATEKFSLGTAGSVTSLPDLAFGCGRMQGGNFYESAGVIGLGRGTLSLVSQIGSSIFSYCLGSFDNAAQTSRLFLGSAPNLGAHYRVAPFIPNKHRGLFTSHYYLHLRHISVAGKLLPIPDGTFDISAHDGSGGFIIDSGTMLTSLVEAAITPLLDAVVNSVGAQSAEPSAFFPDLQFCFNPTPDLQLPIIAFHFEGGAKYVLPQENSFISDPDDPQKWLCLAFVKSDDDLVSIFGYIQQQNFEIVYDLGHNQLRFAPGNVLPDPFSFCDNSTLHRKYVTGFV